ncbi:transporter substrate-binding protein [Kiloniella sp. EL199]|uniref:transporter substrate-binding protein n=1 Tax=Kiloniella sp. EL199 TaxID=2107581 RepID=UPI000EA1F28C|nr:transporter substrate-binding protein [Kiloniella sp. EL199]
MNREIAVGLLYSTTGAYNLIGQDCLDGALMAMDEINANSRYAFNFTPKIANPGGNINEYQRLTEKLLREEDCQQIIGTVTSISRKEVTPIIEKHDGLLWYTAPYEGFECCENIIYTGACPNQHIVPMFKQVIPEFGKKVYLTGTNYVWGWEVNRIARELITSCGGEVTGENYLPFHSTDVERMIETIRETRPSFILNNLIDSSSYALYRAFYSAGKTDDFFRPENCPIISCNITECELEKIGYDAAEGHLSISPYFENLNTTENLNFLKKVYKKRSKEKPVSAFFVNGYATTYYLAEAIKDAQTDNIEAVKKELFNRKFQTPLGETEISEKTLHTALPYYIGRIKSRDGFEILPSRPQAITADPYLVNFESSLFAKTVNNFDSASSSIEASHLKVVK